MKVIVAPNKYERSKDDIVCFLAGGISNCPDWQNDVIDTLLRMERNDINLDRLVIMNPRRENFPIDDPIALEEQIYWEFKWLEECDIFSMYFCSGDSVQPICMYELGRNLIRMREKFPISWREKLVISVEDGYKRKKDVMVQTFLALDDRDIVIDHATAQTHAHDILMAYTWIAEDL